MTVEHFDVLVVGAGISGIGAGYHLQTMCPDRTYAIVDGRDDIGGTWDLFRYPGVRSDSDMHTLGYSFKPWTAAKAIADGPAILQYLRETSKQFGIDRHIRLGHLVQSASWSSDDARWTVQVRRTDLADGADEPLVFTCGYLFMCAGYYSYRGGYTPDFPGIESFRGRVVHPQAWPDDLDFAGKEVVVIGSGATAMTLVPAMARSTAHITLLQRSPTYVVARPDTDRVANAMRKVLPDALAYRLTRWKNVALQQMIYKRTRTQPAKVKAKLLQMVRTHLGPDYDVDKHFTPTYDPWDQRLCLVPNGDLFEAITSGRATVVTDQIRTFTEAGITLASGQELPADIIVTATGLQMVTLGEMEFTVDGQPVDFSTTWTYKGMAYSDVPNLASSFGYINASWTLRADLTCEYVCRLLNHMRTTNTVQCTPRLRESDRSMPQRPWIVDFSAGYMQRVMDRLPRQGDREPWINPQSYTADRKMFRNSPVEDGVMQFVSARTLASTASGQSAAPSSRDRSGSASSG
ncbi:MAG: putative flavoprotein involved in transport [Ilumatobacteraceae bacterium]|nr:putative flavoprotein involved in transport [Ilumatobacteraceae bacterium]